MKHGYVTDWMSDDTVSEESLRESSQFVGRECAKEKGILVELTVFPCPKSIKEAGKSVKAGQCAT